MKVMALRNFIANGVHGHPDKILSQAEVEQIENLIEKLRDDGQIFLINEEEEMAIGVIPPAAEEIESVEAPKKRKKK